MKRCPVCKILYPDEANFCPMDARELDDEPAAPPGPSLDLPTMQARLVGARFKFGPQIGGKRTGEVFSAEDISNGQACAVKIVSPAVFPTPLVMQRTERELKQLMKVPEGRITKIIEVGRTGDRLFVAMELVSGVTLAEILATQGPLPPDQAARLGLEVGEALAEAAKLGVIHRDVSPKNVLVVADARGTRRVKMLNFGVPTPITPTVLGIPEFLSPEQAEGKPVDQRSSIYSMGVLLYTMLTGETPFSGTTEEILRQQTSSPVVPPTQRPAGKSIPPELERLVLKALEKASSRRHLTLRQLLGELETIAARLPLSHPVTVEPAARPSTSHSGQRQSSSIPTQRATSSHGIQTPGDSGKRERHGAAKTMVGMVFPVPAAPPPSASQPKAKAAAVIVETEPQSGPVALEPAPVVASAQPQAAPNPPSPQPSASASASVGRGTGKRAAVTSSPKKGKFRETLWFKKGEVEEAAAEDESPPPVDGLPIEDRYKDDGTVTAADRERLSLRTGDTAMFGRLRSDGGAVPGEQMGEDELARELRGGGGSKTFIVIVGAVVLVVALALIYLLVIR